MKNKSRERANITNVKKLQKAGILDTPHKLSPEDEKVIESLSLTEVKIWVNMKKKLVPVRDPEAKFFI